MIYRLLLDLALTVRSTPGKDYAVACETRLRSDSAGSGRSVFALRLTLIRLGLSKKAPLSLGMADTASYISIATSICIPPSLLRLSFAVC